MLTSVHGYAKSLQNLKDVKFTHNQMMAGYEVACKYGVYESKAFTLAEEMFKAMLGAESVYGTLEKYEPRHEGYVSHVTCSHMPGYNALPDGYYQLVKVSDYGPQQAAFRKYKEDQGGNQVT
jgi:hypothetical protein